MESYVAKIYFQIESKSRNALKKVKALPIAVLHEFKLIDNSYAKK